MMIRHWAPVLALAAAVTTVATARAETAAATSPVTVAASLAETGSIHIGDRIPLTLTLTYPEAVKVHFPGKPFVGKNVRLAGNKVAREAGADGQVRETHTLLLVPMRDGKQKVPAIEIPYIDADGTAGTISTEPLRIVVRSRLANETDPALKGRTPPVPYEQWNWWLIWGLTGLGVALLAAATTLVAVRIYVRRFRAAASVPPPRPAHEIAYERLSSLREERLPEAGLFKQFYLALSEIVREYFGNRYRILALGETSTELIEALERLQPKALSLEEVRMFLWDSDLVKFAKRTPTREEMDTALVQAQLFVDRTREEARERQEARKEERKHEVVAAGTIKRVFAFLVDLLLYSVVSTLFLVAIKSTGKGWIGWIDLGAFGAFLLLRDLPGIGSPGKALTGLRVVSGGGEADAHVGAGDRIRRNVPHLLLLAGQVAEILWMAYDPEHRRMGDRWAGTQVADRRPEQSEATAVAGAVACVAGLAFMVYVLPVHLLHLGIG